MEEKELQPGDNHYQAYVGPPKQYDFMGATQFRLLCTLGLRAGHDMLDIGCGSLRAGRLFITYLDAGRYCGIEPNKWLIEDAIENQLGHDIMRLKAPSFDHNSGFDTSVFNRSFDYIVAQSIFSHTGIDLTRLGLKNIKATLKDDGIAAVTFVEGRKNYAGDGWIYPECVKYRQQGVGAFCSEAGLHHVRIPWYHPRQQWYLLAKDPARLPAPGHLHFLTGAVLGVEEFSKSTAPGWAAWKSRLLSLFTGGRR